MPDKELEDILGFKIPLHKEYTKKFKRKIIDFPKFAVAYRKQYSTREKIYTDMESRFGKKVVDLIMQMT